MKTKKIVVIGGGTGTFVVLSSIKSFENVDITAIVCSTDSGGSTGRLRDEYGLLPVGDLRQCIVALSSDSNGNRILRKLFNYRFSKGEGLKGHSFGNLLLTALTEILESEEKAILVASKILKINGKVIPITFDKVQLVAEYEDKTISYGESMIDDPPYQEKKTYKIKKLWTQPKSVINKKAKEIIQSSDYIILGPGDLYTSTLANFVVDKASQAVRTSKAKIIYITNLVSKYSETHEYKVSDYVNEVEKYIGKKVHYILVNKTPIPNYVKNKYKKEKSYFVTNDMKKDKRVLSLDLLSDIIVAKDPNDTVKRNLLRHDVKKLRKAIESIISGKI